jgi:hypothetical protein
MRSMIDPGGRRLARHLNRLSDTLESFGRRLRDAVSSAVGETVSGIVRETVRALLDERPSVPASSERFTPSSQYRHQSWAGADDPDQEPWFDDPEDYPGQDNDVSSFDRQRTTGNPAHLPRAIAIGLQTTISWLRRSVGRFPVITAIAVGLLTALATYAGGPLAAALVGLAGSAFNLLSLAEVVHTGSGALATFGSS